MEIVLPQEPAIPLLGLRFCMKTFTLKYKQVEPMNGLLLGEVVCPRDGWAIHIHERGSCEEMVWRTGCRGERGSSSEAGLNTMVLHLFPIQPLPDALVGRGSRVIPILLQSQNSASASKLSICVPLFPLVWATSICKGRDVALHPVVLSLGKAWRLMANR